MVRKHRVLFLLVVATILVKTFSIFPDAVERYYSDGIYPVISKTQRILFSWIPFSIGDIFYFLGGLYLLLKAIGVTKKFIRKEINKSYLLIAAEKVMCVVLVIYVIFNVFWGLNYNRIGIARHLGLKRDSVSPHDLVTVMYQIVDHLNALDTSAHNSRADLKRKRNLFTGSIASYAELTKSNSIFQYTIPSVKPSLYSYLGNYLGFTGYYNPFSGEAQVNTTVPIFIQPFVTCHEIGHQLGYAKESEANFAGYLSASSSDNPSFRYSAYFDLYLYGRRYIHLLDSVKGKQLDSLLNPRVKNDIRELREFVTKHANPIEDLIDVVYSQYLKANDQPSGRVSYSEVIIWVVAYYKKFGKI